MPSVLPLGDPAPADGLLPAQVVDGAAERAFGLYVHIPFCAVRCGYCDFNTYTATELGGGASQDAYAGTAISRSWPWRGRLLADSGLPARPLSTVFFGGGTPTLLPAEDLARILTAAVDAWGLEPGAEVTTEANPDSVTAESLQLLADAGFTRVSFGMQSAVPHVLKVLDRTHTPSRVPQVVQWARDAGLAVSLDLIYGTPGESLADWRHSLETALSYGPDHISAYALIVEDGTKLAAQIRRGEVPGIDDDDHAAKYELADQAHLRGRAWLVRGQQLGADPGGRLPAQPRLLARGRLVGHRPRRALPCGRRPLVERQTPHGVRRTAGIGRVTGGRTGNPRRGDPRCGARDAGGPTGRGARSSRAWARPGGTPSPG